MSTPALSRRGFLAAGAATCAAVSPLAAFAREAAAADLNLGIQLYSLRGYKVDEAMKHARDIGFRFVEFYGDMFPVNSDAAAIAAMGVIITSVGSAAVGFAVYFACAISGAIGIRFTLRRIRRALFSRLVTTLREKQNAIAGFGGTTSAVLPALTVRDD
jgi:hypothetical protein